jgi:two-component system nitrate/nitrite response regulator NarL
LDAIEKAKNLKPDLIILDASMPRLTGIKAAPKLKEILPETQIILFTFHENLMRGLDAREIGVDALVQKDRGLFPLMESVKQLGCSAVSYQLVKRKQRAESNSFHRRTDNFALLRE